MFGAYISIYIPWEHMSAHQKMGIDSRRAWVEPTGRDRGSAALSAPPPEASAERQQAGCHGK